MIYVLMWIIVSCMFVSTMCEGISAEIKYREWRDEMREKGYDV